MLFTRNAHPNLPPQDMVTSLAPLVSRLKRPPRGGGQRSKNGFPNFYQKDGREHTCPNRFKHKGHGEHGVSRRGTGPEKPLASCMEDYFYLWGGDF